MAQVLTLSHTQTVNGITWSERERPENGLLDDRRMQGTDTFLEYTSLIVPKGVKLHILPFR